MSPPADPPILVKIAGMRWGVRSAATLKKLIEWMWLGEETGVMGAEWGLWEREGESAAIADAVKHVTQGGGGLLLVEGEAGIGKTRLLEEVRAAGVEAGARVAWGRGTELESEFAFGLVRQLFEPILADEDGRGEGQWQGPAVQARQVFAAAGTAAEPVGDFGVLHGLYWLTANASQDRPLVLVVDDLQWCDAPSLRYLAYLLPRIDDLGVLVVAALRTGEQVTDERLVQHITTDPAVRVLRPHPLSVHAAALLLRQALPEEPDPSFVAACHRATGGSPLLLRELASTIAAHGMTASDANATLVMDLGSKAVQRLVTARLHGLPEFILAVAGAAAVMGDHADLTAVAALADQDAAAALDAADALERLGILRVKYDRHVPVLSFAHPLVQAAVHGSLDPAERAVAHRRAAQVLTAAGADPERIAAHLLRVPPSGDSKAVADLRKAAEQATARGTPGGAYTYLRRALEEPPTQDQYLEILAAAGQTALLVDFQAAAKHLQEALDRTTDPVKRADIAIMLGMAHLYQGEGDRSITVWSQALSQLPATAQDQRRHLESSRLMAATFIVPGHHEVLPSLPELRRLPPHESTSAHLLDCAIAGRELALAVPAAVSRARRALTDVTTLVEEAGGDVAIPCGWRALLDADDDMAMDSIQAAIVEAHRNGSLYALVPAYMHRALGWLLRGQLTEAEATAREALDVVDLTGADIVSIYVRAWLAETLAETGRFAEAEQILQAIGVTTSTCPPGPFYSPLVALAVLQRMRGDSKSALDAALQAGQVCADYDIRNPAFAGWRTDAALAMQALERDDEAREIAAEDLRLSQQWGAPRALGRALRVNGLLTRGNDKLALLAQAITVLQDTSARLEQAKALADYGAALRSVGQRTEAREPLRQALSLSTRCGATLLAEYARTELVAAGGRPRHVSLTGPEGLTPSEMRVAVMAAGGATNRQIAQQLFVTIKTVEVHLSAVYRKLGITNRSQLSSRLPASGQ
ncbi:helix-turn-helix transcriptional regulator [Streptomyces sp. NPDC048419]|uniref:helix-turn-helix transcriptional regulator n=1 Tax=Streptomyces sp. NPDC048419 TaxID=3365547 RepID=UPI00371E4A24